MNLASALTSRQISGVKVDLSAFPQSPPVAARRVIGFTPSPAVMTALAQPPTALPKEALAAVLIASPDFQTR
jgi:hypothetical protein